MSREQFSSQSYVKVDEFLSRGFGWSLIAKVTFELTSFKESKYDRSSKSSCRGECCLGVDEYWPNYRLELTGGQSVRQVFLVEQCNSEKKVEA